MRSACHEDAHYVHRREGLKTPGAAAANKIEAGVVRQTGKKPAPRVRSQAHKRGGDQSSKLSNSVSQEKAAGMLNVSRASVQVAKAVLDRGDEFIARRRGWTSQFPRGG